MALTDYRMSVASAVAACVPRSETATRYRKVSVVGTPETGPRRRRHEVALLPRQAPQYSETSAPDCPRFLPQTSDGSATVTEPHTTWRRDGGDSLALEPARHYDPNYAHSTDREVPGNCSSSHAAVIAARSKY